MLTAAVITGGHHYHVPAFHRLFRELSGVDAYIQHMADFVASPPEVRAGYDVLVFYTHLHGEPTDLGLAPGRHDTAQSVLESLGTVSKPGIVVLHHSLLAFPGWAVWDELVGMADRSLAAYDHAQAVNYHVADPRHPICAGLADWTLHDETYLMADAAGDNHILITTDHPRSMATLAWTREYRLGRVFCLQGGDEPQAWADANFRSLLAQGMRWCGRFDDK